MAGLALYVSLGMRAGAPFIRGAFMAGAAQIGVWLDGHLLGRVVRLERSMAGLAGDAFLGIGAILRVVAGRVALQAGGLLAQLAPVALENGRGESLGVAGGHPIGVQIFVAVGAGLRAGVRGVLPGRLWRRGSVDRMRKGHQRAKRQAQAKHQDKGQPAPLPSIYLNFTHFKCLRSLGHLP